MDSMIRYRYAEDEGDVEDNDSDQLDEALNIGPSNGKRPRKVWKDEKII